MSETQVAEAQLLEVAREAAYVGAKQLVARFGLRTRMRTKTTPTDLVSEADFGSEAAIRALLQERRPGDSVLGEEGGMTGDEESWRFRWVVDPLDGTVNFVFGIPAFAVSVACEDRDGTLAGVVFDPLREECFEATRSGPALLNGEPIEIADRTDDLALAMVATGFGYDSAMRARQADVLARVLPRVRDIRRVGAAALDLAWTACRRFDAYFERGLKHWDLAAGSLIAERAGLIVQTLPAAGEDPPGVVAGPAELVADLAALIAG